MADIDKLRSLLDGDVDHSDLAKNPMLASIAERAYGVSVKPLKMSKPSQLVDDDENMTIVLPSIESTDPLNLMVEVVEGAVPPPIAESHLKTLPDSRSTGKSGLMFWSALMLMVAEIGNLFGLFGILFGDICAEPSASSGSCPAQGATRINLLSVGELDSGWAWSEPLQAGGFGIPDIVLLASLLLMCLILKKRK